MGAVSVQAANQLEADVAPAYAETPAQAYAHIEISSMNGDADESDETVSVADFQQMLTFAQTRHLARLSFWAVNRDRLCVPGLSSEAGSCSGIGQDPSASTDLLGEYSG